ncbi:endonuclease domain-containing protein [Microbacterium sp. G2-8]|uniref:endonuclease domain-containing protein n=1 Tax=Microbacterium sp. G2-8 TaxID=2842454 RepID=UPI001C88F409|nr:DUF559 domain-containing protein [Microbacterium sp. G2-8]
MKLSQDMADLGGVARITDLRTRGHGRRAVEGAVARGELTRPRRGWVALPTADPMLVHASRSGVVLSCITQATRLGLWVTRHEAVHVAADPRSGGVRLDRARSHVHWARPVVERVPGSLEDPVQNVLALTADCLPREDAVATWESAFHQEITSRAAMLALPLKRAAREVAERATPFSDAGTESIFIQRLSWLKVRIVQQVWLHGHRVDALVGDRLVVQVDGGHHVGAQRDSDIAHDAKLKLAGYHVIRVSYRQLMHDWPAVQQLILEAIAQGLHLA